MRGPVLVLFLTISVVTLTAVAVTDGFRVPFYCNVALVIGTLAVNEYMARKYSTCKICGFLINGPICTHNKS